ncbi:MAG: CsgG/HfaB family protein [bacterium]
MQRSKPKTLSISLFLIILLIFSGISTGRVEKEEKTFCIIPFNNNTGRAEYEPLGTGLRDLLISDLTNVKGVRVVDREHLRKVLEEVELNLIGIIKQQDQIRIGKLIGADVLVTGGFTLEKSSLRINVHIYNIRTTQLIKSEMVNVEKNKIFEQGRKIAQSILRNTNIELSSLSEPDIDESPDVNLHFIRALGYYYGCMYDYAIMEFMNTLYLDPRKAEARYWLGMSYFEAKEYEHARIEFEKFSKDFPSHVLGEKANKMMEEIDKLNSMKAQ